MPKKMIPLFLYISPVAVFSIAGLVQAQSLPEAANSGRLWTEDATRDYYDGTRRLPWQNRLGDWVDADGQLQGTKPFASAPVTGAGVVDIDVTALVRAYGANFRVAGLTADVASREAATGQPVLLVTKGGTTRTLQATADVMMDPSTSRTLGTSSSLKLQNGALLAFDQPGDPTIERAILRLTVTKVYSGSITKPLQVFLPAPQGKVPVASSTAAPTSTASESTSMAASTTAAPAPASTTPDPTRFWIEDATKEYYNAPLRLAWRYPLGDWIDAAGTEQGTKPFATANLTAAGVLDLDVTALVRAHGANFRVVGRTADVASREAATGQPVLLVTKGGTTRTLQATADVMMDPSTTRTLGASPNLKLRNGFLMAFDQPADGAIERAILRLTVMKVYSGAALPVEVYLPRPHGLQPKLPDVPIGSAGDIVMRISGEQWKTGIGWKDDATRSTINSDGSLTAWIAPNSATALASIYPVPKDKRRELMCLRVRMTVHKDWTAPMGGKFPGLSNTGMGDRAAVQAGWGGRLANGTRWSARTNRFGYSKTNPFADDYMALGTYAYRVNRVTLNGDVVPFALPVPKGRLFTYDECVKLNTVGKNDGFVAYWINGKPAGALENVMWRTSDVPETLPSEIWNDVYEGGTGYQNVPHDRHTVTIHSLTLSTRRLPYDGPAGTPW